MAHYDYEWSLTPHRAVTRNGCFWTHVLFSFFGSVRSSRGGNLNLSFSVIWCLEHFIFIFLAQLFKLSSLFSAFS